MCRITSFGFSGDRFSVPGVEYSTRRYLSAFAGRVSALIALSLTIKTPHLQIVGEVFWIYCTVSLVKDSSSEAVLSISIFPFVKLEDDSVKPR